MLSPFSQGTLHHVFKGGWAWVIPFDNHPESTARLCSVGVNLDIDEYPRVAGVSPEEEFWKQVNRFPDFQRQMSKAVSVRPFVASERNQFASRQVVGARWCLLPHASDFIDPLFSTGLGATVMVLNALGHRLISSVREDDFSVKRFEYIEVWTKKVFAHFDELVSCSYIAFDNFELMNALFRVWIMIYFYSLVNQNQAYFTFQRDRDPKAWDMLEREPRRGLLGVDNPQCLAVFHAARDTMLSYRLNEISGDEACQRIYAALNDSGLSPTTMNLADLGDRSPGHTFTFVPNMRLLLWGRYRSPGQVRELFKGGLLAGAFRDWNQVSREYVADELKGSGASVRRAWRDMFFSWNGDWLPSRGGSGPSADRLSE
jgi:FADH2 O2-dependent halogenase